MSTALLPISQIAFTILSISLLVLKGPTLILTAPLSHVPIVLWARPAQWNPPLTAILYLLFSIEVTDVYKRQLQTGLNMITLSPPTTARF